MPTAEVLAKAGYRVVVPDLRGHGKTPPAGETATMEAMAGDVAGLMESLGIPKAIIVGFSMGGYVALQIASRHREVVRALALIDTRADADSDAAREGRRKTAAAVREKGMAALVEGMMPKLVAPATRTTHPEVVALLERLILENSPDGAVQALAGMGKRPDMRGKLSNLNVVALIACGEEDAIAPPDDASRMAQAFRGSDFELVPKAGHAAPLENPAHFRRILLEWLTRVAPAR